VNDRGKTSFKLDLGSERKVSGGAKSVSERLIKWSLKNGRLFPWRAQRDPYAILIAEKLLQQTAAGNTVVEAYLEILRSFPTPGRLAVADIRTLKRIIRPLGLGYRAIELRALGKALEMDFDGIVPDEFTKLMSLPGVGEYSARAVLSFAFGRDVPVVDTNVARFLYRYFGIIGPIPNNPARARTLFDIAGKLMPKGRSREFNFAVLDLCAAICKPARALCGQCPVRAYCASAFCV
jgi:A/G-specific adenine glycosylase